MVEEFLSRIDRALTRAGVPYMVIGGQAVMRHGRMRMTEDVDVTLGVSPRQVDDILKLLPALGLEPAREDPRAFVQATQVLPCRPTGDGLPVDFAFSDSAYEAQAISRADRVTLQSGAVNVVAAEDLVIHKIIASRPVDLMDVKGILLKNPALDLSYIRRWLG
ncbi:MAG: hypothetical protein WD042_10345 [Phycisphaeraceae bacterium]